MTKTPPRCILPPRDKAVWAPPLDLQDLAVRLEADGVTSSVAQFQYGFDDVWSMAEAHLPVAMAQKPIESPEATTGGIWKDYAKGMAFAAPVILCCLTVLFLKVSLWGGPLSGNQAVAIAIASVSGFVITGGFLQIIGRRGHFYMHSKEWALCFRSCWTAVKMGTLALVLFVGVSFLANSYFQWLPLNLFGWYAAFNICIGLYLLVSGVLYVLKREVLIALGTLVGTGIVTALFFIVHVPILVCQVIGIVGATGTCLLMALFRFKRLGYRPVESVRLPSLSRLVYLLWPYFAYGTLYYMFLFADRIIAWSALTQNASLSFEFRGDYETALDVCLFAFVLQVGWVHAGLVRFYGLVNSEQKRLSLSVRDQLRRSILTFYARQMLVFLILFLGSTAAVTCAIYKIHALQSLLNLRVALLALAGTPFLAIGLWNAALLIALSRPMLVVAATVWALIVNVCVGYLLSRLFSYDLAILGFDAGACVLAGISAWSCHRLLVNFDYHFFAATT
jgi:hypothetical protein